MAREEIKGDFKPEPTVQLTNKEGKPGAMIKGIIAELFKEVPNLGRFKKTKYLYRLRLIDTNASIQIKQDDKFVEAEVDANDLISLWATAPLHRKLSKVPVGASVEIVYTGKSVNPETGNAAHTFKVFKDVVEA